VYSRTPEEHERQLQHSSGSYRPTGSCSTPASVSSEPQRLLSSATESEAKVRSRCRTAWLTSRHARRLSQSATFGGSREC
jgi:hypothetical protein